MRCATKAAEAVFNLGGKASFDDYDKEVKGKILFAPFIAGWGLSMQQKLRNDEKLSAFAACEAGFLSQEDGYYILTEKGRIALNG